MLIDPDDVVDDPGVERRGVLIAACRWRHHAHQPKPTCCRPLCHHRSPFVHLKSMENQIQSASKRSRKTKLHTPRQNTSTIGPIENLEKNISPLVQIIPDDFNFNMKQPKQICYTFDVFGPLVYLPNNDFIAR